SPPPGAGFVSLWWEGKRALATWDRPGGREGSPEGGGKSPLRPALATDRRGGCTGRSFGARWFIVDPSSIQRGLPNFVLGRRDTAGEQGSVSAAANPHARRGRGADGAALADRAVGSTARLPGERAHGLVSDPEVRLPARLPGVSFPAS